MKTKTVLASFAVASLALAQPAGAATRSYESLPDSGVQSTDPAERIGSLDAESEAARGRPLLLIILLFGSLAALILLLGGGGGNSSPG